MPLPLAQQLESPPADAEKQLSVPQQSQQQQQHHQHHTQKNYEWHEGSLSVDAGFVDDDDVAAAAAASRSDGMANLTDENAGYLGR